MTERRLQADDIDWAVATLGRRRAGLVPHAPIFWAPAEGAAKTHADFLGALLDQGEIQGYRTDESVLIAGVDPDRGCLVDDAAWWGRDGAALWNAFAADHAGSPVHVVCPRYEPERVELVLSSGLHIHQTWWLRELPGSGGGAVGLDVDLPGATGHTVPSPPVYAPPGPMLFIPHYDDLSQAAPSAVETARELGCAGVIVRVAADDVSAAAPLEVAGLRAHCDFVEGTVCSVES